MHDPSQGTGCLLSRQSGLAQSSRDGRKQFAALPTRAPRALIQDTIYLSSPAEVWPHRALESRRVFQDLLRRYFRQILHGCTNPNCRTPTCLSNQKRTSKAPFRRFTVLSARALAAYLAARDTPEHDLCPHQPVALLEEPEIGLYRDECSSRKSMANQENSNEENFESDQSVKPLRRKDLKSFTQKFFDTEALRMLHLETVAEISLQWPTSFKTEEDISMAEGYETRVGPIARNINEIKENMDEVHSADTEKPELLTEQTRNITDAEPSSNAYFLSPSLESEDDTVAHSSHQTETIISSSLRSNSGASRASSPSKNNKDSSAQENTLMISHNGSLAGLLVPTKSVTNESDVGTESLVERIDNRKNTSREIEKITKHIIGENGTIAKFNPNLRTVERPQSLGRFTLENISALVSTLKTIAPGSHDEYKFQQSFGRTPKLSRMSCFVGGAATEQEMDLTFGTQSIIHVLSTTDALLRSFLYPTEPGMADSKTSVEFSEIVQAFRLLMQIECRPSIIISSLWISVGKLHPPKSVRSKSALMKACRSVKSDRHPFSIDLENQIVDTAMILDVDAAHIAKIALAALVASIPGCDPQTWSKVQEVRASGRIVFKSSVPSANEKFTDQALKIYDALDDEMGLSLIRRLVRAITARQCLSEISKYQEPTLKQTDTSPNQGEDFIEILVREISSVKAIQTTTADPWTEDANDRSADEKSQNQGNALVFNLSVLVEWLRGLILREWDGKAEVSKWSLTHGALELMSYLYRIPSPLGVDPKVFYTPFLSDRLDLMEMPTEWLSSQRDRNTVHLLSYPFLFLPSTLVFYFRAINHAAMLKAFESSQMNSKLIEEIAFFSHLSSRGELRLHDRLKIALQKYLILDITREDVLTDALNQLWRRERRELMRPLKVIMGTDRGEVADDFGGVQQEFFRLAVIEAFRPEFGLFTTDESTRMSWFQACSLEPLYKFELLGILTSLAVYNGLTLPVTFPLALYRKLLDLPVTRLAHIIDGWPMLVHGLEVLLSWPLGNVEDVFMRSYVFEVEALGRTIPIDMEKIGREDDDWYGVDVDVTISPATDPSNEPDFGIHSPFFEPLSNGSEEGVTSAQSASLLSTSSSQSSLSRPDSKTCMVNEENREQFVEDYIFWMTDRSIRPQYEAFARGFFTCIDRKALTIFTPDMLKLLVEGTQEIDVDLLQEHATYESCSPEDDFIKDFWHVVRNFSPWELRRLLEFVTSSDRIPINGISSIHFSIHKQGDNDQHFPGSFTCFGRLLLPQYSSREILKEKLIGAITLSQGFGRP